MLSFGAQALGLPLFRFSDDGTDICFPTSPLFAGFVLGPSLKIDALISQKNKLFPYGSEDLLNLVSILGMKTRTGRKAWAIALSSLMITSLVGLSLCYGFMGHWQKSLSSALVMDVIGTVVSGLGTAVVSSLRTDSHDHSAGKGPQLAMYTVTKYVLFVTIVTSIGRPAMRWIVRNTPEGRPMKKVYTYVVVLMTFFAGLFGVWANQTVLGGVILLGLAVPEKVLHWALN
ncbi:unnamed protein product [Sphenostylis stenocarpa]|uniref:Uncharacterized protein n=1 Tax=Sphenostylis stenocarpa TaxID=92480 RepID=A0AA86SRI6_9FABA|nr:unnamed protein product [Sphenostylis stenocarpa]